MVVFFAGDDGFDAICFAGDDGFDVSLTSLTTGVTSLTLAGVTSLTLAVDFDGEALLTSSLWTTGVGFEGETAFAGEETFFSNERECERDSGKTPVIKTFCNASNSL